MTGVSSTACTDPAGRLDSDDGCTASPSMSGGSTPATRSGCRAVLRTVGVGQVVQEREGRAHSLGDGLGGREVGEVPPDVGLQPLPELPEVTPQATDLLGHLGQLVRAEHDKGHHQDDQQLRRAEEGHDQSVPAVRPRRRPARAPLRWCRAPGRPPRGGRAGPGRPWAPLATRRWPPRARPPAPARITSHPVSSRGHATKAILPTTRLAGIGPKYRLSSESVRLSPITKYSPAGTV